MSAQVHGCGRGSPPATAFATGQATARPAPGRWAEAPARIGLTKNGPGLTGVFGLGVVELARMSKPTHTDDPADPQATNPGPPVVNLLDDRPTKEDLAGGGHKRVADAIARLIEREQGGKAIALEGTWGSGKSSVVQMLDNAFAEFGKKAKESNKKKDPKPQDRTNNGEPLPTDYLVYTFDAWKHEGDPLRVAFLRGLSEKLHAEGLVGKSLKEDWDGQIDRLEGVTKRITQNHPPDQRWKDLSASAILFASIPAVAAAVALSRSGIDFVYKEYFVWILIALAALPLAWTLVVLARYPIPKGKWLFLKDETTIAERLLTRQPVSTTTTTSGDGDVTSIRFEDQFSSMMEKVLSSKPNRRIVLVIDNLDRLDCEDALAVWSTMRTFLEIDPDKTKWAGRMWVLVPYDRAQMGRLWDGKATEEVSGPLVHHDRPSSFLDKTFAIRFDVPPLLLANWEKALGEYLKEALGKLATPETIEAIARLSRRYASKRRHPPTPRHLKLFVNDIGALVRQHGTRFPLDVLAAYAILRRAPMSSEQIREDLRTKREAIGDHLPKDWLDESKSTALACLIFNTHDEREAMELLLIEPLIAAIRDGDIKAIRNLASIPSAQGVIDEDAASIVAGIEPRSTPELESILATLEALHDGDGILPRPLISRFAAAMYRPDRVLDKAKDLPELVRRFMKLTPRTDVLGCLANRLNALAADKASGPHGAEVAKAWINLHKGTPDAFDGSAWMVSIFIPTGTERNELFLSQLWQDAKDSHPIWDKLAVRQGDGLIDDLLPADGHEYWTESTFQALHVLAHCKSNLIDWKAVGERIAAYLTAKTDKADSNVAQCVCLLFGDRVCFENAPDDMRSAVSNRIELFKTNINTLYSNDSIAHLFFTAMEARQSDLAATLLLEIGSRRTLEDAGSDPRSIAKGRTFMNEILTKPEDHAALIGKKAESTPFTLRRFIQKRLMSSDGLILLLELLRVMDASDIAHSVPATWLINHWDTVRQAEAQATGITGMLLGSHERGDIEQPYGISRALMEKQDFDGPFHLLRALIEHGTSEEAFYEAVEKHLHGITADAWAQDIASRGNKTALLCAMREKRKTTLGTSYYTGLDKLAGMLVEQPNKVAEIDAKTLGHLLDAVGSDHKHTLAGMLRDRASSTVKDKRQSLYKVFGEPIREAMLADPKASDVPGIVILAANGSHGFEPDWLPGFLTDPRAPDVVKKAGQADRDSLLATVRENAAKEGDGDGPYATFLKGCQAAGLEAQDTPGTPDDTSPV